MEPPFRRHPRFAQPWIHSFIPFTRYWLSLVKTTSQGRRRASRPRIAERRAMRLLVVSGSKLQ